MTGEEAIEEVNKVFEPAFANYIITALTEGATVSDIQRRWGRAYEAGVKDGLEQEPCEDAISLASVFEIMGNLMSIPYDFDRSITEKDVSESMDKIRELPRVTPQEPFKPMVEIDLYSVIKQKYIEREVLDKISAEIYNAIEFERKWLCDAGHTSKDIDIALNAIKSKVKDVLEKGAESEG